jgi:hypothetical protein
LRQLSFFIRRPASASAFPCAPFRWFSPGPGFALAAGNGRCKLVVISNAQLLSRITMDAGICHGKPCIRGLRYPVDFLLDLLSGDMTEPQILANEADSKYENTKSNERISSQLLRDPFRSGTAIQQRVRWGNSVPAMAGARLELHRQQ